MEENWKRRKRRDFFFFQNFNNICFSFEFIPRNSKLSLATTMKCDLELLAFTSHLQSLHNPVYRSHFCPT